MNTNPNFTSILDKPAADVKRPPPLPTGTYLWIVINQPRIDKSPKEQTQFVEYTLRCLQPMEDVDAQAIETYKENGGEVQGKELKVTFWLTEAAAFRLVNKDNNGFLDLLGLDKSGKSLAELISEAPGNQVLGGVTHSTSRDGQQVYANITSFAAV
jgi:ribosomal protein S10